MGKIVGVGFRPTEQELVDFYLKHKLLGDDSRVDVIPVIDLCHVEPSDVPGILAKSRIRFGDPDWFFFSPVDFKYSNSKRVNRKTEKGFWKATGKDRDISSWNTNTLIATKKNLVYYTGIVSCGVKSYWVIHEYHAVTFHESERCFVLCRLMRKSGKTTEGGTDPPICGEEEPSIIKGGTFSGVETIFLADPQTETYVSQIQPSPREEASFPNYPLNNVCFGNEKSFMQDEYLNRILADENLDNDEESSCTFVDNFSQKDTNIVDSSFVHDKYFNYDEYHSSKRLKLSKDVADDASTNQETKESMIGDGFWRMESSSCDSTPNGVLEINCTEVSSSRSIS
ncbi:NAC domain-containing protein 96-like [Vigna unguiculata]|uniref:NAC domain-containing protein 96-like n=1 Tax=Vigna unguiculata TaxID=3917 RepID=UPI0010165BA7|nr:NAC domain-containing protein 96-like [Vigna unguiculata]